MIAANVRLNSPETSWIFEKVACSPPWGTRGLDSSFLPVLRFCIFLMFFGLIACHTFSTDACSLLLVSIVNFHLQIPVSPVTPPRHSWLRGRAIGCSGPHGWLGPAFFNGSSRGCWEDSPLSPLTVG